MENETITVDSLTRKVSVTFERKIGYDNYGNATARAWVEDDVPRNDTDGAYSERLTDLLNVAKAAVYDSLGIECFKDDTGVLREKHAPVVSLKQAQDNVGSQFAGTTQQQSSGDFKVMNPADVKEPIPAWVGDLCRVKGITAIWVNHGQHGQFYREAVKQGETPRIPNPNDPGKAGIMKASMLSDGRASTEPF